MRAILGLGLLLCLTSGCYMHSVETRPWRPDEVYTSDTTVHFFWGITGTTSHSPCEFGMARVATYMPWWGSLVSLITIGIVVPTQVDYVCSRPSRVVYPAEPPPAAYPPSGEYPPPPANPQPAQPYP